MFKTITVLSLREGTDVEDFIKYHTGRHAQDALEISGGKMRKYVINRIIQPMGGENNYFAFVEMWWDSKEDHDEYVKKGREYITASGKTASEDFESRGGVFEFKVLVDEREIPIINKEMEKNDKDY